MFLVAACVASVKFVLRKCFFLRPVEAFWLFGDSLGFFKFVSLCFVSFVCLLLSFACVFMISRVSVVVSLLVVLFLFLDVSSSFCEHVDIEGSVCRGLC